MLNKGAIIIEGHIQGLAIARSLSELRIPIYIVDTTNCIARYSKYCNKFFRCPDFNSEDFALFLLELAKKEKINGWVLYPSNDHAVHTISKFKSELEIYYNVITPSLSIIQKIYDKATLTEIAKENNIPVPKTLAFKTEKGPIDFSITYPVILKGRNGLSFYKAIGKKALLAQNPYEFGIQLKKIRKSFKIKSTIVQELIPSGDNNKTISFTAFCKQGSILQHWTGIKVREHPVRFGTATFAQNTYNEECHKQSIDLIRALEYTGVCEIEYINDPRDGKYKLIEINPRTWLWVGLAIDCGVDYPKLIYNHFFDNWSSPETGTNDSRFWINPLTDFVYSAINILRKRINIKRYVNSLRRNKTTNALFVKNDNLPGIAYIILIFKFLRQR